MSNARSSVLELPIAIGSAMILAIACGAGVAACSSDDASGGTVDSGAGGAADDAPSLGSDPNVNGGDDAGTGEDAASSGDAAPAQDASGGGSDGAADMGTDASVQTPHFCAARDAFTFCSDFDEADPLASDAGATAAWDEVLNAGTLTISDARAVSAPGSLSLAVPIAGADGRLTKSFNQAIQQVSYEFSMYIESQPKAGNAGSLITDLQFTNDDAYGFRVLIFSKADGSYDRATLEHNGAGGDINPITLNAGAWNHIKMTVAFSSSGAANKASLQAYVNDALTPVVDKSYDAPAAKAPMGRVRLGKVFAFGDSQEYKLNFDNVVLKLQ